MRSAMIALIPFIGVLFPSRSVGDEVRVGVCRCVPCVLLWAKTSCLVILPPGPDALTCERSTPSCSAVFLAANGTEGWAVVS